MNSEKLPVLCEDLYQFKFVSEVSFSPDGKYVSYVINQADESENKYHSSLWALDTKTKVSRLMANRGEAKAPVWLSDGSLIFVSERDQKNKRTGGLQDAETCYYRISPTGGEAISYMTIPVKVEKLVPAGADLFVVQATADDGEEDVTETALQRDKAQGEAAREGEDYYIFEELPFWFNGKGIRSRKRTVLYLYDRIDGTLKRITPKLMEVLDWDVSESGRSIAYSGVTYRDIRPQTSALYTYYMEQGLASQLTDGLSSLIDHVYFAGDHFIAYTSLVFDRTGKNPDWFVYDRKEKCGKKLPFADTSVGSSVGSDAKYGSGKTCVYDSKKKIFYMIQTEWGTSSLVSMDLKGKRTRISKIEGAITGFDIYGDQAVMTAMRGNHMAEVYEISLRDGSENRLTGVMDNYLMTHQIMTPERFTYQSHNGYEMEGYVIRPAGYRTGTRYPAVLEMHGGPKGVFGSVFFHEMQCLASRGYFVFYTNPRGSDGRGQEFADLTEQFGKIDFDDFMEFTDVVLERYADIDPERVGISGGSYGGFMCNWMIGHTNRYHAAVSQRSISNYLTKVLYTDIGYYANRMQMGAYPWEDFDKVWSSSPVSAAANVKTPTLFLQSDEDYRCWMGDAIQMYSAIKRQGVDARLVLFHGENHELSRSGKPHNRVTRLRELTGWFEKYL